jgi:AcrR family transcriptional regulator
VSDSAATLPEPPTPPRTRRPQAQRTRGLDREAIVEAALALVDEEGLAAVTMRRVAEKLGTGGASLYAHVDGKDALMDLVVDRVIGELEIPPQVGTWQEQVKEYLRAMRGVLAAHRDLAQACLARIPVGENALRVSDALMGVLRAGGLPDQIVAYAADLLPLFTTATAYEESLYAGKGMQPEEIERYIAGIGEYFAALPPERFPNIVALAGPLTKFTPEGDDRFEFGIDVLVAGLEALAARSA